VGRLAWVHRSGEQREIDGERVLTKSSGDALSVKYRDLATKDPFSR
jgi:hypothetical protein